MTTKEDQILITNKTRQIIHSLLAGESFTIYEAYLIKHPISIMGSIGSGKTTLFNKLFWNEMQEKYNHVDHARLGSDRSLDWNEEGNSNLPIDTSHYLGDVIFHKRTIILLEDKHNSENLNPIREIFKDIAYPPNLKNTIIQ